MRTDPDTSDAERQSHRLTYGILSAGAMLALLVSVAFAVPDLRDLVQPVTDAEPGWLLLAVLLELASCLCYVVIVRLVLADSPARQVRWLGWTEMAFGALIPLGGAGGLAVGAWAMRAWGIGWQRIANRSAVIFLLTNVMNVIMLGLGGIGLIGGLGRRNSLALGLVPTGVALVMMLGFLLLPRLISRTAIARRHGRLGGSLLSAAGWVHDTHTILRKPDWRLIGNLGYLGFDMAVLWACLRAVGTTPPLPALVVGYQLGYLANILPVPGGVGVLEGGLIGALLLYGLPARQTAAAVLIYHAIALWVPALGGTIAFTRLRRAIATEGKARLSHGARRPPG